MNEMKEILDAVYNGYEGSSSMADYSARHGIQSAAVLTAYDDEMAGLIAASLAERIEGKTVVEIGGGIGLLALHLGAYAKRVFCIEANVMWAWTFAGVLLEKKPKHVSYLFGAAEEFRGCISGDVALFCSHSGIASLKAEASHFAPEVIDVYGEIIASAPHKFDPTATMLRSVV